MKKTRNTKGMLEALLVTGLILITLTACESKPLEITDAEIGSAPAGQPLHITSIKIFPEPIVGEIATMEVEVISTEDETDVKFTVDTLESVGNKIHLVSGDANWQGSLAADQPKIFQVKICVTEEGSWPVRIFVSLLLPDKDNNLWYDFEIIQLESTLDLVKLIPSSKYTFSQEEYANRPTPRPIVVSSECSGNSK